jgi:hypothetical protein
MTQTNGMTEAHEWSGRTVKDRDGEQLGKIDALYFDKKTDNLDWALVNPGPVGSKATFVPLAGAAGRGEHVVVQVEATQVRDAPKIDPDREISEEQEVELFRHYGVDYTTEGTVTATGNGQPAGLTSVEERRVGGTQREQGSARLRKYVVTEQVRQTVAVQREEVRVEREPSGNAGTAESTDGHAISQVEHELVVHQEEVVAEERPAPRERMR